jgi:hypothetical protein
MRGIYHRWARSTGSDKRAITMGMVTIGVSLGAVLLFGSFVTA